MLDQATNLLFKWTKRKIKIQDPRNSGCSFTSNINDFFKTKGAKKITRKKKTKDGSWRRKPRKKIQSINQWYLLISKINDK